jgi:hypothetical protein
MNVELAGHHLWNIRRAWEGANLCRDRLITREKAAPVIEVGELQIRDLRGHAGHDVDYYAWESVRVLKMPTRSSGQGCVAPPRSIALGKLSVPKRRCSRASAIR